MFHAMCFYYKAKWNGASWSLEDIKMYINNTEKLHTKIRKLLFNVMNMVWLQEEVI